MALDALFQHAYAFAVFCGVPFAILTCVAFVGKGRAAVRWTREDVHSSAANIALLALNALVAPMVFVGVSAFQSWLTAAGAPRVSPEVWNSAPFLALVVQQFVATDFIDYWNHRWMHSGWLWPIHAVHHSDPSVNISTSHRVHVLEPGFMALTYVVFAGWMGLPPEAAAASAFLGRLHNQYVHMNIDWGHGRFAKVLASPRYHRWHHADVPEAHGKNLANVFPIWDVAFGTYYCPGRCDAKMGFAGSPQNNVLGLMAFPFKAYAVMAFDGWRLANRRRRRGAEA